MKILPTPNVNLLTSLTSQNVIKTKPSNLDGGRGLALKTGRARAKTKDPGRAGVHRISENRKTIGTPARPATTIPKNSANRPRGKQRQATQESVDSPNPAFPVSSTSHRKCAGTRDWQNRKNLEATSVGKLGGK